MILAPTNTVELTCPCGFRVAVTAMPLRTAKNTAQEVLEEHEERCRKARSSYRPRTRPVSDSPQA